MRSIIMQTKRNIKLFFKDKAMFFTSIITPLILLLLYSTFLANVYKDSFLSAMPDGFTLSETIINGVVGGQLLSSLLAVSCITVAFCSNLMMVQDKSNGTIKDLLVSPVKSSTLSISYYIASFVNTFIVCIVAFGGGLVYLAINGCYLPFTDILLILGDIVLLIMFGTALSSIINTFLSTQGQMSAVGTIISSCYGFICGAYMPISSFGKGLQKVLSFLPGTYGTSLIKNHCLNKGLTDMADSGVPSEVMEGIRASIDCNFNFLGHEVTIPAMYIVLIATNVILITTYIVINIVKNKKK